MMSLNPQTLEVGLKLNRDDVNEVIDEMVELIARLGEISYQARQVKTAADDMTAKAHELIKKFERVRFEFQAHD
jgi:methyl-accepting chemotaxis protein